MNLSIFTVFLKNRDLTSKIKRSKVTDYAALTLSMSGEFSCLCSSAVLVFVVQINLKKDSFRHTIRVSNSLDPGPMFCRLWSGS